MIIQHSYFPVIDLTQITPPKVTLDIEALDVARERLQICSTGVSQDFINPFFAVVLPFGSPGMPHHMRITAFQRAISRMPNSYADHLTSRYESLSLLISNSLHERILSLAGPQRETLDSLAMKIKVTTICLNRKFSPSQISPIVEIVRLAGLTIFGADQWKVRGGDAVLNALPLN